MAKFFSKKRIAIILAILLIAVILYLVLPVSVPLITALVTAIILEPPIAFLHRRFHLERKWSVMIIFISFLLCIFFITYVVSTKVIGEAINLVEGAPQYINNISDLWIQYEDKLLKASEDLPKELVKEVSDTIQNFFTSFKDSIKQYLSIEKISSALADIPNYLVSFIVYLIALFLFMLDLPKIKEGFYRHLSDQTADKVHFMTSRLSFVIFGFLKAQFLVSIIIFIVSLIGLLFITPHVAVVMSLVIWVIDLIPIIGSIVILAPWALYYFIMGDITIATQLSILAAVLLIIRRTIEPKVMGSHIGLSPLATLIAMYLGLKLLGILGFIIGPLILILFSSAREAGIINLNYKI
ncbi:sporulation integral membrane protein YtvI [Oikeobacillus pervagus]|uniref:Sporulation integral membrane protein YtvI n=1 Tax=Oikeobacillus pervagus TaxID=1325931 RepID=A0AAJ1WJ91_9BACI|nr:sporulation integral membrane protein YtvI [Oikeobacillus pervagus]MDQ0215208.1 sporulation integral membrane protein YtvI [Oikeobacillus pervagus]